MLRSSPWQRWQCQDVGKSNALLRRVGWPDYDVGNVLGMVGRRVSLTQKPNGIFIHLIDIDSGTLKRGRCPLATDVAHRIGYEPITQQHICCMRLRLVLGDHRAKGSLVSSDRLRFDFSHQKAVSADELDRVQQIVKNGSG